MNVFELFNRFCGLMTQFICLYQPENDDAKLLEKLSFSKQITTIHVMHVVLHYQQSYVKLHAIFLIKISMHDI